MFLIILSTKIKMYQRKRKDNFSKKIEQMIVGRNKRSCNEIGINNIFNINDSTNINGDTNINSSTNINDNNSIGNSNYSNDNGHYNDIDKINSSPDKSEVTLTRLIA